MSRKKSSKVPKNDFEYDEGEICGFTDGAPVSGDCISSFSFNDDPIIKTTESNAICKADTDIDTNIIIQPDNKTDFHFSSYLTNNINNKNNSNDSIKFKDSLSSTKEIFDNRRTPLPNGAAPAINGETPTIKRSYTLRNSTIRKINELKSIHPDINICISTIVDIAIAHYYNHIVNEGGTQ